jgi:hypothetical protein
MDLTCSGAGLGVTRRGAQPQPHPRQLVNYTCKISEGYSAQVQSYDWAVSLGMHTELLRALFCGKNNCVVVGRSRVSPPFSRSNAPASESYHSPPRCSLYVKQLVVKIYAISGNHYLFIAHYKMFCYVIVV